jgi:hypothetical protein
LKRKHLESMCSLLQINSVSFRASHPLVDLTVRYKSVSSGNGSECNEQPPCSLGLSYFYSQNIVFVVS